MSQRLRVAIIEDNATARATIRSHLIVLGNLEVASFSTGTELKNALKKQNFELLIFDFHLGQRRNGVEWVQILRQSQFIQPSTGIVFITADRLPQTIGQIIDTHPDLLLLKPYTINALHRGVNHYLEYRKHAATALRYMDEGNTAAAITTLDKRRREKLPPRVATDLEKLRARLLLQKGDYPAALAIYERTLAQSNKVLWAQWGKLKCHYQTGDWSACHASLDDMLETLLTRDKAFEWLAGLSFEQESYEKAEFFLDHIQDSDLSLPATRLKTMTYQKQNRIVESIDLLQKKREYNRSTKERFDEFTFELAEFYLSIAQESPHNHREESLSQARKLMGVAARSQSDLQVQQRHDYLLAYSYVMEDQLSKAREVINREHMNVFQRSSASTLIVAARVVNSLGDEKRALEMLELARNKSELGEMPAEQQTLQTRMLTAEKDTGLADKRAEQFNEQGQQLFVKKQYLDALAAFYRALQLTPDEPAYQLNMLQTLLVCDTDSYRAMTLQTLIAGLLAQPLSDNNQRRYAQLVQQYPHIATVTKAPDNNSSASEAG